MAPKRLQRFRAFASLEFHGVEYMSPQDFLDSLTLNEPRERVYRRVLDDAAIVRMLKNTPTLRAGGGERMFRRLGSNGIISYAEYLFILTLLTKSRESFVVAFLMFDEDDNMHIDKNEFLKIKSVIAVLAPFSFMLNNAATARGKRWKEGEGEVDEIAARLRRMSYTLWSEVRQHLDCELEEMMRNFSRRYTPRDTSASSQQKDDGCRKETRPTTVDTTILVHLFGHDGKKSLSFDEFQIFYTNLQRELIEIEFEEFARGKQTISTADFARLVLRYSTLRKSEQASYLQRAKERGRRVEGITLEQFRQFSMFLNNIEQFTKAVRLYSAADIPVSRSEFIRAVHCSTGFELDAHLVDALFCIFDANNDDRLSYSEFIAIMNDRLNRGFGSHGAKHTTLGWKQFRNCVVNELAAFRH